MERVNEEADHNLSNEQLIGEAGASLSLVTVILTISALLLAIITTQKDTSIYYLNYYYLILCFFGTLYSAMFYGNATATGPRLNRTQGIGPMQYGNISSEYWGLFPLIICIPCLVLAFSNDLLLSGIVLLIDIFWFAMYQFSKHDMLSRYFKGNKLVAVSALMICLIAANWIAQYSNNNMYKICIVIITTITLLFFSIVGLINKEK